MVLWWKMAMSGVAVAFSEAAALCCGIGILVVAVRSEECATDSLGSVSSESESRDCGLFVAFIVLSVVGNSLWGPIMALLLNKWYEPMGYIFKLLCCGCFVVTVVAAFIGKSSIDTLKHSVACINTDTVVILAIISCAVNYLAVACVFPCLVLLLGIYLTPLFSRMQMRLESHRTLMTSSAFPFSVDFFSDSIGFKGKLGMSMSPGKTIGKFARDLEMDVKSIKSVHNCTKVVVLLQEAEFAEIGLPSISKYNEMLHDNGIELIHFPVHDKWIPDSMSAFHKLITHLCNLLNDGETILVHCSGGKGRTATVVIACLLYARMSSSVGTAIAVTRKTRPGTIKNPLQQFFLHWWYHTYIKGV
ncbi:protein phosphatase [Pelomyxa schiedti]|nr:protein phosphatase [Pelomyxa schiedti]